MTYRLFILLTIFMHTSALYAHPHEWMNVIIEPEFNAQNNIVALKQTWLFDPFYAHILLEPVLQASTNEEQRQGMHQIEQEIITKLEQNDYYTFSQTLFSDAEAQSLYVDDGYLYMSFQLPLAKPQPTLNFKVYEPTYYVEMRYDEEKQIQQWPNGCTLSIIESNPSKEMVYAAYAIDIDETGPKDLGRHFAQTSELTCPQS